MKLRLRHAKPLLIGTICICCICMVPSRAQQTPVRANTNWTDEGDAEPLPTVVVETECGRVRSAPVVLAPVAGRDEVMTRETIAVVPFMGIRYARALSSHQQRWRAPEPAVCWDKGTEYDASSFNEGCVQTDGDGSEDCLYLHIFTPLSALAPVDVHRHTQQGGAGRRLRGGGVESSNGTLATEPASGLLPVMVYIHGGGLLSMNGHVDLSYQAGDRERPMVWVAIEHRLNIFGFLATSELSEEQGGHSGNYGLMDQQEALRWIQTHIQYFGGDRSRVTVSGHSSGGTSVLALMSSPASRGLFQAAISLSGSPNITMDLTSAEQQNRAIVTNSPCAWHPTSSSRVDCMRSLPVGKLLELIPESWSTAGMWDLPKGPQGQGYGGLPVVDGRVIAMPLHDALREGIVDVPLVLGNMAYESDCCSGHRWAEYDLQTWEQAVNVVFAPFGPGVGDRINALYRSEDILDPQRAHASIMSDYALTCGNMEAALQAKRSQTRTRPVYLFHNRWSPSQPVPTDQDTLQRYAYHGWDLSNWFRLYPYTPDLSDLAHSNHLRDWFYDLASTGSMEGWTPAGASEGGEYVVMVIQPPDAPEEDDDIHAEGEGDVMDHEHHAIGAGGGVDTSSEEGDDRAGGGVVDHSGEGGSGGDRMSDGSGSDVNHTGENANGWDHTSDSSGESRITDSSGSGDVEKRSGGGGSGGDRGGNATVSDDAHVHAWLRRECARDKALRMTGYHTAPSSLQSDPSGLQLSRSQVLALQRGDGPTLVTDYKKDVCDYFRSIGLWQNHWWVN